MIKYYSSFLKNGLVHLFILYLLFGCISTNKLSNTENSSSKMTYQEIAKNKFGEYFKYKLNEDKSYALCQKVFPEPALRPNQLIEFFVYDIQKGEIIYENKIARAKISWYNNTQLLVVEQKGYVTDPSDTGKWTYVFDLRSKKKITSYQSE